MFFIKLAARNVFRQYGRTTLSMVSIVAGVAVIIFSRGLVGGFKENIIRAAIDTSTGHVDVFPADYPTTGLQHPVDHLLTVDKDTTAWLDANTVAWTKRLIFVPQVIKGPDSMRVRAIGFSPETDAAVFPRTDWRVEGKIPATKTDGVLVSRGVARVFELKPGMQIVLTARTSAGAINALEVSVAGVLTSGNPMIDNIGIFVPMPLVDDLLRPDDHFSHLAVRLDNRNHADAAAGELRQRFGAQAQVKTWFEECKGLLEAQDLRQIMFDIIALALVAIAATGIANTVLMAAYERVKEIGTLRAMGMTRVGVVALFVGEGIFMGLAGSLAGAALGGGLVYKFARDGIDLSSMIEKAGSSGTYNNVPFSSMLYTEFSVSTIVAATIFGLLMAVFSSIYPAVLASGRPPAEALRAD